MNWKETKWSVYKRLLQNLIILIPNSHISFGFSIFDASIRKKIKMMLQIITRIYL